MKKVQPYAVCPCFLVMVGPLFIGCPRLKTGNVPEREGKELAHIKVEKEILHWQPLLETGHTTQSKATEDRKGHLKTSNLSMNHCPSGEPVIGGMDILSPGGEPTDNNRPSAPLRVFKMPYLPVRLTGRAGNRGTVSEDTRVSGDHSCLLTVAFLVFLSVQLVVGGGAAGCVPPPG